MPSLHHHAVSAIAKVSKIVAHSHQRLGNYRHPHGPGKPLVAMLHGFAGAAAQFNKLRAAIHALAGDAFDCAAVDTLDPSGSPTLEGNVAHFDAYLTAHDLRGRELYLVGHSIGGLVIRQFTHLRTAPLVRAAVLVCTPNGGVNTANVLPWIGSRNFDARFNRRFPIRAGIPHLQIYGTLGVNPIEGFPNDNVVGRRSALRLLDFCEPGAEVTVKAYPVSHWKVLDNPAVMADVAKFLLEAEASK
jgi:hypothetical protein